MRAPRDSSMEANFTSGIKDFVDLCVTGIVFLLGGFVTQSLSRWWTIRTNCVGGLWNALGNLSMLATSMWPTNSPEHREARELVARYSLLCFNLLFVDAQAADTREPIGESIKKLEANRLLLPEEGKVLEPLPARPTIVVGWLAAFFENALSPKSTMACAFSPTNCDNGRYSTIMKCVLDARTAINLGQSHLQCQLPYGYIHLILVIVHATCIANSMYSGIHLGSVIRQGVDNGSGPELFIPLILIRCLRIVFVPLLLDGMMVIGTVIANPLGDEADDFPSGSYMEELEDECLAVAAAIESFHPSKMVRQKVKES